MARQFLICLIFLTLTCAVILEPAVPISGPAAAPVSGPATTDSLTAESEEPPEGYYPFVESPNATPPRVRPPPYRVVAADCAEARAVRPRVSAHNLCGDLNRGLIPNNPLGHSHHGEPYPFELIRNHTLRFLSRTLPVLRRDDTLPRVTHVASRRAYSSESNAGRVKRSLPESEAPTGDREGRGFCDNGGVFCMLYRAINGDSGSSASVERREDPGTPHPAHSNRYEGPPTPCPARVEYATPVFARNYQGVWRYVVQIPYEGYFTQTVEVTRCMQSRCHYLDGGCLSSPRWVSLLVAEMHYPPAPAPSPTPAGPTAGSSPAGGHVAARPPHLEDFQEYQQYLQKRAGQPSAEPEPSGEKPLHCDGHDEMGCFQVRLYYDWFLVPGSCKCWRPDYFARYVHRRHNNEL